MGAEMMVAMKRWGTWEELVLGGAVLRHGTQDWDAVASELRARTLCPYGLTPEVCKAKYEDLQHRYSGRTAWFEELRKQRMAELKQALEQSEDSIGSLESKLETLKAENVDYCHVNSGSNQTESPVPFQKLEGVGSSSKETSKDGLSAGSFTQETRTIWAPECQIPAAVSAEEIETKLEVSESSKQDKVSSIDKLAETIAGGAAGSVRKRRGKRKRKECNREVKEGSIGESDCLGSANVVTASQGKESSIGDCGQIVRSSGVVDHNRGSSVEGLDDLMGIFNSVVKNENASVFRRRHDSQKRARYKKMIRQHMDFDSIRSRIDRHSITSARELFRDLLLLTNNAVVFYSKNTREYKSALFLRDIATETFQQHYKDSVDKAAVAILSRPPMSNPPVKPRSVRPRNRKLSENVTNAGNVTPGDSLGAKKPSNADSPPPPVESSPLAKKGFSRPGKVGRGTANQRPETPVKGRKRARGR